MNFVGVAYSGGFVSSYGVVIDLASTRVAAAMPILYEHSRNDIVGRVSTLEIAADFSAMPIAGELFSDVPEFETARQIARLAKRGAPFQLSIGLFQYTEEWVPAGATLTVNGRDVTGPCTVLRNGLVREVSVVTLGADTETEATFFSAPGDRPQPTQDEMTLEQLTARVAELTAQLTAKDSEIVALKLAESTKAAAVRTAAMDKLLAETGDQLEPAEREVLMSMSDAAFGIYVGRMGAMASKARAANSALFSDVASTDSSKTPPKANEVSFSADDIYAARRKAQNQA